jgi:hypothetical protein
VLVGLMPSSAVQSEYWCGCERRLGAGELVAATWSSGFVFEVIGVKKSGGARLEWDSSVQNAT